MLLPLFLFAQSVPVAAKPLPTIKELRYEECMTLATKNPGDGLVEAGIWIKENGGYLAVHCLATSLATDFKFADAAPLFVKAAQGAEAAKDTRAVKFWAQAGNAAIAADQPLEAVTALDAALASNSLTNPERGDALIDKARALVGAGREKEAGIALSQARTLAPENGTAFLLSATLARRMGSLVEAQSLITTAAILSPYEPAIPLEAGNIAAAAGNEAAARRAWEQVIKIAPNSRQAVTAKARLTALHASKAPSPVPDTQSR
jgi:tetratricopeptide (TPR) repeat protein